MDNMVSKKFSELKKLFSFSVDKETKEEVLEILVKECYSNQIFTGWMVLILQGLMIGLSLFSKESWTNERHMMYFLLYLSLFTASALFLVLIILIRHKAQKQSALQTDITGIFVFLALAWACGITILDQYNGPNLSVFSYIVMAIPILGILRPWQCIFIFTGSLVILNGPVFLLQNNPLFFKNTPDFFSNIVNSMSACVLAAALSIVMYRFRFNIHYKQFVINSQYEKINALNEQLANLVLTDPLTQLGNRRFLEEKMQKLLHLDRPRILTGMMLDIDFFKQYNDHYGHQAGDHCLQEMAGILRLFVKDREAFVVRYGGEEFFLCLLDSPEPEAETELLRKSVEDSHMERDDLPTGCVTVSIGMDVSEDLSAIGMDEFLRRCDFALYQAKKNGRNQIARYRGNL